VDTAHLKAFLRIADTGSISRASDSLGVTQPSLSQLLLRLEEEIGFRLFNRTARGVTLTEAGLVFQERARRLLHDAEQAISDARQLRDEVRGAVMFAMPPSMAQLLGATLVETLAEQAPLIELRIIEAFSGAIRGWIEAEKIDLGLLYDLGPLRHLTLRRLASDELYLAGPPKRFGTRAKPAKLPFAALAGEKLAAPGPQHGLRQLLEREASLAGVTLQIRYEIDSLAVTTDLVAQGACLTVLPHCALAPLADAGRLSLARIGGADIRRTLSLVRNPSHVLTHASVRVEATLLRVMAQKIADGSWLGRLEE
jgi:LysR family transcriptional regulator, nitrogen assimilation regulatory protein